MVKDGNIVQRTPLLKLTDIRFSRLLYSKSSETVQTYPNTLYKMVGNEHFWIKVRNKSEYP